MRVVIPYKRVANNDLFWAIKSIEQNYEQLEHIIVVGDRPSFEFNGEFIPCGEHKDKEYSIFNKLKQVHGQVLFTNDDIFFLNRINDVPNYYLGLCGEKGHNAPYYKNLYSRCPPHWLDFDAHCPMVIDTDIFEWKAGMPLKSQYGNTHHLTGVLTKDFKVKTLEEVDLTRPFYRLQTL